MQKKNYFRMVVRRRQLGSEIL